MISANGGLPAHRYTPQVTHRWPRGSEPDSAPLLSHFFPAGTTKTKRARSIATLTRTLKSWENLGFAYNCFHLCSHPQWYQKAELSLLLQ